MEINMKDRKLVGLSAVWCCVIVTLAMLAQGCGKTQVAPQRGPTEVGTVEMRAERVVLTAELPGRTSAFLVAEIRPQVNGLIQKRLFVEGSDVHSGDLLYQIDPAQYLAAWNQARAALAVVEANLPAARSRAERLKGLAAIHAVGEQDADDAAAALAQMEANVDAASAAAESARINLLSDFYIHFLNLAVEESR